MKWGAVEADGSWNGIVREMQDKVRAWILDRTKRDTSENWCQSNSKQIAANVKCFVVSTVTFSLQ